MTARSLTEKEGVAQHTPGPWHLVASTRSDGMAVVAHILGAGQETLAQLTCGGVWSEGRQQWTDESQANARLMAAAPDLLAALKDVIGWVPGQEAFHTAAAARAVERARVAISRATGGSQ